MAVIDFYFDVDTRRRVAGLTDSSQVPMPRFSQGDTYTFRIRALQPTGAKVGTIYTFVPNSGKTLQLAVGTKLGNSTLHYVEQYSWNLNGDSADPYFYADVAFNTQPVSDLLGSTADAPAFFEVKLIDGLPKTIFSDQVFIEASVIKNSTLTVLPGQTPASMEMVLSLLQNLVCQTITLQSPDKTHSRTLGEANDGSPYEQQNS